MTSLRSLFAALAVAIAATAFVAGCGDDDEEATSEDPQTVLDETFNNEATVSSGNLTISASVSAEGQQGGSFEGSLSGPFQGDPDEEASIPQLDWTASLSGEGGGQSIDFEGGIVVTEDNAFVEYNGKAYEVGADQFAQVKEGLEAQAGAVDTEDGDATASFKAGCEQALEQAGVTDTSGCDIDLSSWLTNLTNEGTEDVGGSESVHISGDADVQRILSDIGGLAAAVPQAAASGFDPSQLSLLAGAVSEASIDVYSTVEDNLLSKLEMTLGIDPSALAGEGVEVPVESIDVDFSLEIADINEEQTIEAPSGAKPIDELLGGLGVDLGDLGGAGLPIPGAGAGAGGGAVPPDTDKFLQCLQGAQTPDEINACAAQQ